MNELALFAGAGGGFSVESYLAGLRCARSSSSATRGSVCCSDSGTECCPSSPSGTMCVPLTESRGEGLSTLCPAASPVRTYPPQEKAPASPAPAQVSGLKCTESFARFDRDTCLWRTPQLSLLAGLDVFSETWPRAGIMRRGWCLELPTWELRTGETGFGFSQRKPNGKIFLPTPTCEDSNCRTNPAQGRRRSPGLAFVVSRMLPTPTAHDAHKPHPSDLTARQGGRSLAAAVMYPTPTCQDAKNNGGQSQMVRNTKPLNAVVGGALNPAWVEWLMGWPIGWTALEPLGTDRFRWWLRSHLKFLENV